LKTQCLSVLVENRAGVITQELQICLPDAATISRAWRLVRLRMRLYPELQLQLSAIRELVRPDDSPALISCQMF
jgi:hypothetical protein